VARNLDIVTLRSLVAVVEKGGVSKAAQALHLTQSAISQHVKRLEELLDARLFDRSGKSMLLTPKGEELLDYAEKMLGLNDRVFAHFDQVKSQKIVSIGLSEHISHVYLPRILTAGAHLADIRLDARIGLNQTLYSDLNDGRLDIAVLVNEHGSGTQRPVAKQTVHWVRSPGHRFAEETPLPIVVYGGPCMFRTMMLSTLDAHHIPWKVAYSASSIGDLKAALQAGLGVSALLGCEIDDQVLCKIDNDRRFPKLPDVDVTFLHRGAAGDRALTDVLALLDTQVFAPGSITHQR